MNHRFPLRKLCLKTVISDGRLLQENLKKAKKDGAWLRKVLHERSASVDGTFLLTVDGKDHIYYIPKEVTK